MTNIWIFNHYAVTPDMPGGTRHYDLARELIKRNYSVTIFASSFHHGQHKELKLAPGQKFKIENHRGINFVWLKTIPYQKNNWPRLMGALTYAWRAFNLGKKIIHLEQNITKPDVIIGSSPHLFASLAAYWLAKHYRAKFIFEIRDLWPQSLVDIGQIKKFSLAFIIMNFLARFLYQRSSAIIILAQAAKTYLTNKGVDEGKIYLIPNGVDLVAYRHQTLIDIKDQGEFRIIYSGSMAIVNALEQIFPAIKMIPLDIAKKIKLIFVGAGIKKNFLIKQTKTLNIQNIEFLDPIAKIDIPDFLSTADAFLLIENKIFYGSSNKLMDYLASARPIIFCTPAPHNIVASVHCGILADPNNPNDIASAIIKLYQMSSQERQKMGERARQYVEQHHSIVKLTDKLEEMMRVVYGLK